MTFSRVRTKLALLNHDRTRDTCNAWCQSFSALCFSQHYACTGMTGAPCAGALWGYVRKLLRQPVRGVDKALGHLLLPGVIFQALHKQVW